jgi:antiviral helicase SKI2
MSLSSYIRQREEKESTEFAVVLDCNQPIDEQFEDQITDKAKEFDFKLDTFQMQAILHLEQHHNVFVSAHTSAGKTVVADYAIAMAFRSGSRVIYTSPIKALSNQKFRDFKTEFNEVGLLTGSIFFINIFINIH